MVLICEGPCNPTIGGVDSAVQDLRVAVRDHQPPFGEGLLWAAQRQLRYTLHEPTEKEFFYRCTQCGTRRRFGSGKWSAT